MSKRTPSIDQDEINQFAKDSDRWWDPLGPFAPLHKLNPVRLSYIKGQICRHFGRDEAGFDSLRGLRLLDIGCGGGLVCEPMARLGADVTGIDADQQAIAVAKAHAKDAGLKIEYLNGGAEELLNRTPSPDPLPGSPSPTGRGTRSKMTQSEGLFDIVLALEIIEHVPDPAAFVATCARLLKPGGLAVFSTLNRTPKSFALGIVAAEYILRWVPRGTHSWKKFVKPSELAGFTRQAGLTPQDISGLVFQPLTGVFALSKTDADVNYFMAAVKD